MERFQNSIVSLVLNVLQEELVIYLVLKLWLTPLQRKCIHQVCVSHNVVPSLDNSATACQGVVVVVGVMATILGKLL